MTASVADTAPDLSRVAVVGTSGSGKTTLARSLADAIDSQHIELDALHWGPDWEQADRAVFRERVQRAVAAPRWICDGNYSVVRDLVWARATAVIWLDLPFSVVFTRAVGRTFRRAWTGELLFDGTNRERLRVFDPGWIPWWVIRTWRRNRRLYRARLDSPEYAHLTAIELRTPAEVSAFLTVQADASDLRRAVRTASSNAHTRSGSI